MRGGGNEHSQISLLLEKRRRIQIRVREKFSRYGDKVCDIIMQAALLPKGLPRLMEQLGLPRAEYFDQRLSILARYLTEHGVDHFIEEVKARRKQLTRILRPQRVPQPWSATETIGPLFDEEGNYVGPERRDTQERRRRRDRRYDVATIRVNRRFGRDRRQRQRRKADRASLRQG